MGLKPKKLSMFYNEIIICFGKTCPTQFLPQLLNQERHSGSWILRDTWRLLDTPYFPSIVIALPALFGLCASDLNFLAVGDWGKDNVGEYADAAGMETVGKQLEASFAVMLGDNFYSSGE